MKLKLASYDTSQIEHLEANKRFICVAASGKVIETKYRLQQFTPAHRREWRKKEFCIEWVEDRRYFKTEAEAINFAVRKLARDLKKARKK